MTKPVWKRLRKDEYVMNDNVFRMTKKKLNFINVLDKSVLNDRRFI